MADGVTLSGLAAKILSQDVDLAFGFEAEAAPGAFVVQEFSGDEAVFDCFEITVDLVSDDPSINLADLLDTPASLGIYHKYDVPRFLHGQIAEIEKKGSGYARTFYRATLKPVLHRLQYHSDARIFQDLTILDTSKTILEESGIVDVDWRIDGDHQPREYCVQYGETSYDFLRRIWAEEGVFFWFEHTVTSHKMIVSDAPLAMPNLAAAPVITYNNTPGGTAKGFWVSRFDQTERLRATKRVSKDYSFKQPAYHQRHEVSQYAPNGAKGDYELYHYPGRHKAPAAGQPFNDHALEAHRVDATTGEGKTNNIQLSAGFSFELSDHTDAAANTTHRLLQVNHKGTQPAALGEDAPDTAATTYAAAFTSQPARLPYRPVNPNPKPMVEGPQIAIVTGPDGEEIYCDEFGRIKVWFPWDRHGEKNENSSCWVRVSQNWAGGTWGHMAIPRIGHEVVVDFLSGDPDQPIVTGRTYHATNKTPYKLPEHKTRMTIRSDTHKGQGFNELRFEDEAGREEIFVHAQKDLSTKVLHNQTTIVDENAASFTRATKADVVGRSRYDETNGSHTQYIGPENQTRYTAKKSERIKDSLNEYIQGITSLASSAGKWSFTTVVKGMRVTKIYENESKDIDGRYDKRIGGSYSISTDEDASITSTKNTRVRAGKHVKFEAGESFTVVCGKSRFLMQSDGSIKFYGKSIDLVAEDTIDIDAERHIEIDTAGSSVSVGRREFAVNSTKIKLN